MSTVRGGTAAIVPAAGRGERLGPGAPKALRSVAGIPILVHAVDGLLACGRIGLVVVAAPPAPEGVAEVRALLRPFGESVLVVPGGETRQRSVALALRAVPEDVQIVLVHDAARALTPPALIAAVIDAVASGSDAVIPVLPVADTIKSVDAMGATVTATVDRSTLRAVQTPQGFRRALLAEAHAAATAADTTDDAGLVERLGLPVTVVPGHAEAFKVTTPFDLLLAEAVWADRAARATHDAAAAADSGAKDSVV
jgi:2-C-methyl-D-erythritol 4-phosphate cytidylyltransferase